MKYKHFIHLIFIAITGILLTALMPVCTRAADYKVRVYDTGASQLLVRTLPDANSGGSVLIPDGTIITITQESNGFGYTSYQGYSGWVRLQYTQLINDLPAKEPTDGFITPSFYTICNTDNVGLALRLAPSNDSSTYGYMMEGTQILIEAISQNGWGYTTTYGGPCGWVNMDYLIPSGEVTDVSKISDYEEKPSEVNAGQLSEMNNKAENALNDLSDLARDYYLTVLYDMQQDIQRYENCLVDWGYRDCSSIAFYDFTGDQNPEMIFITWGSEHGNIVEFEYNIYSYSNGIVNNIRQAGWGWNHGLSRLFVTEQSNNMYWFLQDNGNEWFLQFSGDEEGNIFHSSIGGRQYNQDIGRMEYCLGDSEESTEEEVEAVLTSYFSGNKTILIHGIRSDQEWDSKYGEYSDNTGMRWAEAVNCLLKEKNASVNGSDIETASQNTYVVFNRETNTESWEEYARIEGYSGDGMLIWEKKTNSYSMGQNNRIDEIGIANGMFYYLEDGTIVTLNLQDGSVIWSNSDFGSPNGCHAWDNEGTLFICGALGTFLYGIDQFGNTVCNIYSISEDIYWPDEIFVENGQITIYYGGRVPGILNLNVSDVVYY